MADSYICEYVNIGAYELLKAEKENKTWFHDNQAYVMTFEILISYRLIPVLI